jgi:hypothetical protein
MWYLALPRYLQGQALELDKEARELDRASRKQYEHHRRLLNKLGKDIARLWETSATRLRECLTTNLWKRLTTSLGDCLTTSCS